MFKSTTAEVQFTSAPDVSMPVSAAEPRSWRPFRILLAVTLVLTTIQAAIGGPLAGGQGGGFQVASNTSFSAVVSAITGSGGLLIFHAFEGVLIFVLSVVVAGFSFRYTTRMVRVFAPLSLVAALIATAGGYLHMGGSPVGIPLMSEGFIATYAFLFMTLYFTK
ncbi:MAG TPA: hypothetical protein VEC02_04715 [Nitrososphaerales archaeon]|nr:hypothetical protein [Nitrososphaerales archaeon]